jgi:hypothetical protein
MAMDTGSSEAVDDTLEWREAMISWAEATHHEVRSIRRMVGVFFVVWILGLIVAVIALAQ